MAKKKSAKQQTAPVKDFSSSPFRNLKGLSAFVEQKPPAQAVSSRQPEAGGKPPGAFPSDSHSFVEEMDFLGVKPLPERVVGKKAAPAETLEEKPLPMQTREEREEAVFLEAVGSVEKVFKDEWPDDEPLKQAVPRRMKQVERGQLKPEAELDLHGLTIDEASAKALFFLHDAVYQGWQTVLIITGKGLHSKEGPVLRQAMEALLNQQREQVLEWGVAPPRYGGSGALVVFLRQAAPVK